MRSHRWAQPQLSCLITAIADDPGHKHARRRSVDLGGSPNRLGYPGLGTSAMPVWPAAGSAAARRLPLLRPPAKGSS